VNFATLQKQCVAAFEDQLRKEDQQCEKNMGRPDLVPAHHVVTALYHSLIISLSSNHADWIGEINRETTEHAWEGLNIKGAIHPFSQEPDL